MNLNLAAAVAALCGLACGDRQHAAHAAIAARPPRLARAADPIVSDSLVRALVVNGIRWRLDSTMTLASAQTTLGESPVHKPGGHDEPDWICYTISLPSESLYLLLRSDGMGGEQDWLGSFELAQSPPQEITARECPRASGVRSIRTDNGLFVGMPMNALLAIMHTPAERANGRYVFDYHRIVRPRGQPPYEQAATLEVSEKGGLVTRLAASYAERS